MVRSFSLLLLYLNLLLFFCFFSLFFHFEFEALYHMYRKKQVMTSHDTFTTTKAIVDKFSRLSASFVEKYNFHIFLSPFNFLPIHRIYFFSIHIILNFTLNWKNAKMYLARISTKSRLRIESRIVAKINTNVPRIAVHRSVPNSIVKIYLFAYEAPEINAFSI